MSSGYFELLGVGSAYHGRLFSHAELGGESGTAPAPPVTVVSHGLWRQLAGGVEPSPIDTVTIDLNSVPHTAALAER